MPIPNLRPGRFTVPITNRPFARPVSTVPININLDSALGLNQLQPLQDISNVLQSPSTWFNVVGVIIGLLLIILALNIILRKSV